MTQQEFLSEIKKRGAVCAMGASAAQITLANTTLQQNNCATLPMFMIDLYKISGGVYLGSSCIFGPTQISRGAKFPIPSITEINLEASNLSGLHDLTVFGRNDLFWFAFDAFGDCTMLSNLNLKTLRKYDDVYRAMHDCLIAGKM